MNSGQLGGIQGLGTVDLEGAITPIGGVSGLSFAEIGPKAKISVAGSLGSLNVPGNVDLGPNGSITVTGDVTGPINVNGGLLLNGGKITIGNDLTGQFFANSLTIQNSGLLSIGRDATQGITVNNDLTLDSVAATCPVGRTLDGLTVNGNIIVTPTGGIPSVSVARL